MPRPAILFVCLGNICRSPLAEAAFRQRAEQAGLDVDADSAGTGSWHIGSPPDPRAQATALRHGVDIAGYRGRRIVAADFDRFSHIFALDRDNLAAIKRLGPCDGGAEISLLLDLVPGRAGQSVADPYHGEAADFERTWADVEAAAEALVAQLAQ